MSKTNIDLNTPCISRRALALLLVAAQDGLDGLTQNQYAALCDSERDGDLSQAALEFEDRLFNAAALLEHLAAKATEQDPGFKHLMAGIRVDLHNAAKRAA